jgi:hypothetical protein
MVVSVRAVMSRVAHYFATIVLSIVLIPARPAAAQPNDVPADDATACRDAVASFMTALETGDAEALRLYIHTDRRVAAQQMGAGALNDCEVSQRELERAITRTLGQSPATQIAGPVTFSKEERAAVAKAEVQVEGPNDALLVLSPSVSPVALHRSRMERRWRIRLATISGLYDGFEHSPSASSFKRIKHLQTVAEALQVARRQVEQETLTNPAEARAAIQQMIESAMRKTHGPRDPRTGPRR